MQWEEFDSPLALRALPAKRLPEVAEMLRKAIIDSVGKNGGHLASSLGTVELIVALHRVFDIPREKIFFDVGHQAYAHKLLTGRRAGFDFLRSFAGVSGFPAPWESPCDPAVSGHAGSALSAALGAAAADPDSPDRVIAVVGDGASGCGVTFEALNCAFECRGGKRLIVILNDNQMSISRNVGALRQYLNRMLTGGTYNRFRSGVKNLLRSAPRLTRIIRTGNDLLKGALLPPGVFFEALGFRYLGPADGHDLPRLISLLQGMRDLEGPLLFHVVTEKGHGCEFARRDPTRYHGISGCDPVTGRMAPSKPGFSRAFAEAMMKLAVEDEKLAVVTPAMLEGTGLAGFAAKYPQRTFDVGIAEEHAVTFAGAMAAAGKHPVCAMYDTFLQRALDNVYHDVALAELPLVIASDRAGAVEDGPTHHGIYTCGFLRALPGVTILSPACCCEVEAALRFALSLKRPVILRYPRGAGAEFPVHEPFALGKSAILRRGDADSPVLWSVGAEAATALRVAELLADRWDCTVVDARFLKPFDEMLARSFAGRQQVTIEDHVLTGGLFSALNEALSGIPHEKITGFGWPADRRVDHGRIAELRRHFGLLPEQIAARLRTEINEVK